MPKGHPIDDESLHAFLWEKADRLGRVRLSQTDLAAELGITKWTMSRIITRLVEARRMKRRSNNLNNRGLFMVEDPEVWNELYGDTEVSQRA